MFHFPNERFNKSFTVNFNTLRIGRSGFMLLRNTVRYSFSCGRVIYRCNLLYFTLNGNIRLDNVHHYYLYITEF